MFDWTIQARFKSANGKYYFNRLSAKQQRIYAKIYSGVKILSRVIKLPLIPMNELSLIFNSVLQDNPLIFYVSGFHLSTDLYKKTIKFAPDYKHEKKFVNQSIASMWQYLQVFDSIKALNDIEKEIFVHDYCLNNFSYDYFFHDYSYSALGPIFNQKAVCEGFASFVKLAYDYVGLESLRVTGRGIEPLDKSSTDRTHEWNIVSINDEYYHLDVTFDLTLKDTVNRYDYFNLTDADIQKDHIISSDAPKCVATGSDYFTMNSLVTYNSKELENFIANMLIHGQKHFMVKLMNVQSKDEIANKVLGIAQKQYGRIYKSTAIISIKPNLNQMIFEICFA